GRRLLDQSRPPGAVLVASSRRAEAAGRPPRPASARGHGPRRARFRRCRLDGCAVRRLSADRERVRQGVRRQDHGRRGQRGHRARWRDRQTRARERRRANDGEIIPRRARRARLQYFRHRQAQGDGESFPAVRDPNRRRRSGGAEGRLGRHAREAEDASVMLMRLTRRELLKAGMATGASLLLPAIDLRAQSSGLIQKKIPSSGESLPAIGLGTARRWESITTDAERAPLRDTLREFKAVGATVIDSSPTYG